uniref:Uncharacterized protein n=1 Tax=Aegilops tauschii subsp. strangulata TaxID=200361 RepID=A0A453PRV1_AEGTS
MQWEEQGALPLKSFSGSNPHLSVFFGMPLHEQGAPRGERENEVGSPHFFISPCPFRMRFARHWRFDLLLFLHWRVRMDFAVLSQRK